MASATPLANNILGNDFANFLDGKGGQDTMTGGRGNDTYVVDNAGDKVVETAGEGTDTVVSSVAFVLGADVENLKLVGAADTVAKATTPASTVPATRLPTPSPAATAPTARRRRRQ